MNPQCADLTNTLQGEFHAGTTLLLLFDFDGTLAALVEHPDLAILPTQVREALDYLNRLPGIHVGVLSGRALSDLREKIRIHDLLLAGNSGLELDFCGVRVTHPNVGGAISQLEDAAESLQDLPRLYAGSWLERKRFGMTIHFRLVCERQVKKLVPLLRKQLARFEPSLRIAAGPRAIEISPNLGWTKGSAVRMFHDFVRGTRRLVVYAGDHDNDIDAFAAVMQLHGITIGVGADVPGSPMYRFGVPDQLHTWLSHLASLLRSQHHRIEKLS